MSGLRSLGSLSLLLSLGCAAAVEESVDDHSSAHPECDSLPTAAAGDGPKLQSLVLECQGDQVVVPAVTVTHPDGSAAIDNVEQRLFLCADLQCSSTVLTYVDDLFVGQEEYFGETVEMMNPPANLETEICATEEWPVEVVIRDLQGRSLARTVCAQVTDNR